MTKDNKLFNQILMAIQKSGDVALSFEFQKAMMLERYNQGLERQRLIQEITKEVLANISATVDISEAYAKISELDTAIKSLGK